MGMRSYSDGRWNLNEAKSCIQRIRFRPRIDSSIMSQQQQTLSLRSGVHLLKSKFIHHYSNVPKIFYKLCSINKLYSFLNSLNSTICPFYFLYIFQALKNKEF